MPDVILATCAELPGGDEDAPLLQAALAARGIGWTWSVWDDPTASWTDALVVLRSTWDYTPRRAQFLDWVDAVPRLANAADVVHWNTDKTYLHELQDAGVPIVPTSFAAPGETARLPEVDFVVKPSVGAGSRGAGRFTPARAAEAHEHAAMLHAAGRTVLVQPYLDAVDTDGETALLYFGGGYSHAIRKAPMLPADVAHAVDSRELYVEERIHHRDATPAQRTVGDAAVAFVTDRFGAAPLYARVDLLPGPDGPVVIELELTEPSLFLAFDAEAPGRLADAVAARL